MAEEANPENGELATLVNPDGSFVDNYLDFQVENEEGQKEYYFDEETRADETMKNTKDLRGMASQLRNSQKMVGKDKISIPCENADDKEWDEVFTRLGMPEKAEDYGLTLDDSVPEPLRDKEQLTWFGETARKYRLLPFQVQGILKDWNERQVAAHSEMATKFDTDLQTGQMKLKGVLGAAYEEQMQSAEILIDAVCNGLDKYGIDGGDIATRLSNDIKKDPRIGAIFITLAGMISEDRMEGITRQNTFTMKPSEAQAEIDKINGDPKHPYWISEHPDHENAVERMSTYMRIVSGG